MVMTHTYITQVQKSVGSKDTVESDGQIDGQTDATDYFAFPANAVGK